MDSSQYHLIRSVLLPDLVQTWNFFKNEKDFLLLIIIHQELVPKNFLKSRLRKQRELEGEWEAWRAIWPILFFSSLNSVIKRFSSSNVNNRQIFVEKFFEGFKDAWNLLKDFEINLHSLIFKEYSINYGLSCHLETLDLMDQKDHLLKSKDIDLLALEGPLQNRV